MGQTAHSTDVGGKDTGPNPEELLMASLGACATITVQMYAERHEWPLKSVRATLSHARVLAENFADSGANIGRVDRFETFASCSKVTQPAYCCLIGSQDGTPNWDSSVGEKI